MLYICTNAKDCTQKCHHKEAHPFDGECEDECTNNSTCIPVKSGSYTVTIEWVRDVSAAIQSSLQGEDCHRLFDLPKVLDLEAYPDTAVAQAFATGQVVVKSNQEPTELGDFGIESVCAVPVGMSAGVVNVVIAHYRFYKKEQ